MPASFGAHSETRRQSVRVILSIEVTYTTRDIVTVFPAPPSYCVPPRYTPSGVLCYHGDHHRHNAYNGTVNDGTVNNDNKHDHTTRHDVYNNNNHKHQTIQLKQDGGRSPPGSSKGGGGGGSAGGRGGVRWDEEVAKDVLRRANLNPFFEVTDTLSPPTRLERAHG